MNPAGHKANTPNLRDQHPIAYLDHQVWCGMAENDSQYLSLRTALEKAGTFLNVVIPYSIVHIHELAEIGKLSGMSRDHRFERALPKLEFIREISRSAILEANKDYSKFELKRRDPIEAFNTFTEVELTAAATHNFTDLIPKVVVREIQQHFDVGSQKLNDLSEDEAINRIDLGLKNFTFRCQTDKTFHRAFVEDSKEQVTQIITKGHVQSLAALDQVKQLALDGIRDGNLTDAERELLTSSISNMEIQKVQLEDQLSEKIREARDACENSYFASEPPSYTFEMMLAQSAQNSVLPRSLNKTMLLDFFGFKSKLNNRRSDFFDALHREYLKVCTCFVTDDSRLQDKLGTLNTPIAGTKCQLLNSEGFEQILKHIAH